MGIRLDWEIEAEQSHVRSGGEDPLAARQRRARRLRFLLVIVIVMALIGGAAAVVNWRLRAVDSQIEEVLRNTVDAEVAALRIGDLDAFTAVQRSASQDWLMAQEATFDHYQALKQGEQIQLTGQISDVAIDGTRARVQVQEIIDGVPYTQTWFYWRYEDGWRHVPPDYTFWGELETYEGQGVVARYRTVDEAFATALSTQLQEWLTTGCAALDCGSLPLIEVEVLPDETLQAGWSDSNPWAMRVPSPYVKRARADLPFALESQFPVANLLAERLVSTVAPELRPVYPTDAYYLRQAVVSWLVGKFVQVDTNAFVVSSLAQNYGDGAVGRLLRSMQPSSNADVIAGTAGVASLDAANLDWRDFLTWRLVTEDDVNRRRDEISFLSLYDTHDEAARAAASRRFSSPPAERKIVVLSALLETGQDGIPTLRAVVEFGEGAGLIREDVLFRLADGNWRRAN